MVVVVEGQEGVLLATCSNEYYRHLLNYFFRSGLLYVIVSQPKNGITGL